MLWARGHAAAALLTGLLLTGLLLVAVAPAVGPAPEIAAPEVEATATCEPTDLTLRVHLDPEGLARSGGRGGLSRLRVEVEGTEAPVRVELVNHTPGVVALQGGNTQVIRTTGGADNHLARTLATHRAGEFEIRYRLHPHPCPEP